MVRHLVSRILSQVDDRKINVSYVRAILKLSVEGVGHKTSGLCVENAGHETIGRSVQGADM